MSTRSPSNTPMLTGWMKAVLAVAVVLLLLLATVEIFNMSAAAQWKRYAAELRDAGEPLTFEEIEEARAKLPDDKNGAKVLAPILETIRNAKFNADHDVLVFGSGNRTVRAFDGIPGSMIEPSRDFLEQHRAVLDELAVMRAYPAGQLDVDLTSDPIDMLLPDLSSARKVYKLEYLDALIRLVDGDLPGAAEAARLQFNIAGTFNEHPTVVARLVQIAIEAKALDTIELTLWTGALEDSMLMSLIKCVETRLESSTMLWAFRGERAFFSTMCEQLANGKMAVSELMNLGPDLPGAGILAMGSILPEGIFRKNQIVGTELLTRLVEAFDDPGALIKAANLNDTEVPTLPRMQIISKMLLPSLSRATVFHSRIIAKLRCAHAALAAERFRLEAGRLPTSLGELVPDYLNTVPIDPFAGRPMRLIETDTGIVIYSIGEDQIDDGGSLTERQGEKQPRDFGFRLLRPEERGLIILDER